MDEEILREWIAQFERATKVLMETSAKFLEQNVRIMQLLTSQKESMEQLKQEIQIIKETFAARGKTVH